MAETNLSLTLATLAVAMGLEMGLASSGQTGLQARVERTTTAQVYPRTWEVSQTYRPPNRQAPDTTVGGASRGGCLASNASVRSLMPNNNLALTTQEYPTLYWYIPQSEAKHLELELRTGNSLQGEKKTFAVPNNAGVLSINLEKIGLPPLKVGQTYHWYFRMVCDIEDRSGDVIVEGWIERTELNQTLEEQLESALLRDRPSIYAEAGIWQDSLALLAQLRQDNPNDRSLAVQWEKLLKSVQLDVFADKPLIDCCTKSE